MRISREWFFRRKALAVLFLQIGLALSTQAQIGSATAAGSSQGATANQLPLSGRTTQGGSVSVTQAPVPGVTTTVNTINPNVQVQGNFSGSVTGKTFSG